jgi:hypothetical protein
MNRVVFREELEKIMPGYKWTVKNPSRFDTPEEKNLYMEATGIQSAGFNRLSTLWVCRREKGSVILYEATIYGYGLRSSAIASCKDEPTLARCLRGLQSICQSAKCKYGGAESYLEDARKKKVKT